MDGGFLDEEGKSDTKLSASPDAIIGDVRHVREQIAARRRNEGKLQQSAGDAYSNRIVFKSRGRILFLPVSDIRWIGAEENYVRVCTETESHLLR